MKSTARSKIFYGWVVACVALFSLVVSNGLAINGIPIFYKFVQTDLVDSGAVAADKIQSVFGLAPALTSLLSGFLAPSGGLLIQKLRPRLMMIFGCFILGAGLFVYSRAHSPLAVYAAHALLGTSLGFVGVLTASVLMSEWFAKKRGAAFGIVLTGTSLGGVLIPQIAAPLIQNYGWRTAMIALSSLIWIFLLPAVFFLIKNRPSDLGLTPDGALSPKSKVQSPKSERSSSKSERSSSKFKVQSSKSEDENLKSEILNLESESQRLTPNDILFSEAVQTPLFWVFALCAALVFYAIFVVSQQLNLYLQSPKINFTAQQAGAVQSLLFGCSVIGKFIFGWLADRFPANRVMLFSGATLFAATLILLEFDARTAWIFAVLFGLNYGGTFVLLQLLIVEYFGLREYGKILGALTVIETTGGALGIYASGKIADRFGGDYAPAFNALIIVSAAALILFFLLNIFAAKLRRPRRFLPVALMPLVGAAVSVIAAPVLAEIAKITFGAQISPEYLTAAFCLAGLLTGISMTNDKLQMTD